MLKTKTKTKRADANGGQQNQKSEYRPELLADAVMQKKTLRPARVAAIIYPVVEDDLRANGEPVFASCAAMERNLIYAFSKGLISGRKTASRAVWMEFESALSYVTTYVEVAKTSDKRVSMPRKTPAHVEVKVSADDESSVSPYGVCGELPVYEGRTMQFVLQRGDLLIDIVSAHNGDTLFDNSSTAAIAALYGLGYTLRRIEKEVK